MDDFNNFEEFDYDEYKDQIIDSYELEDVTDVSFGFSYQDIERIGFARDEEELLGTVTEGLKISKFDIQNRTPEDIFRIILNETIKKYDLSKNEYDEAISVMKKIKEQDKKIKYKNPKAILFALMVFNQRGEIDKSKLNSVYDSKAKNEDISKIDLLRYARFIERLLI